MLTLGGSIHTLNKHKEPLLFASKENCLEVNAEKTKYILMCHAQNAGQNHNIKSVINPLKGWDSSDIW